jgi:hypothetical protein
MTSGSRADDWLRQQADHLPDDASAVTLTRKAIRSILGQGDDGGTSPPADDAGREAPADDEWDTGKIAEIAAVSPTAVRQWMTGGRPVPGTGGQVRVKLNGYRSGTGWRCSPADFAAFRANYRAACEREASGASIPFDMSELDVGGRP